jgi:hypothetical protein
MKRKTLAFIATAAMLVGLGASTASAAPPAGVGSGKPAGIACQQAGIGTLQDLGLLSAVARGGIEVVGIGTLPFRTVLSLHRSNPELFQTGGVSVVVPGLGIVDATWCD